MNKTIEFNSQENQFIEELKQIVNSARGVAYSAVNFAQVQQNWLIGQRIVMQEQNGKIRAEYGKHVIELASKVLTAEFGKGFSLTNIKNFKAFYLIFNDFQIGQALPDLLQIQKSQALSDQSDSLSPTLNKKMPTESITQIRRNEFAKSLNSFPRLSWSHYERLMRVANAEARNWYMHEAETEIWAYRTLDRNINTQYYERMLLSQNKKPVEDEMKEKTRDFQHDKLAFIKNPTVLEFLGLQNNLGHIEKDLENAIIDNLQKFLLELGKGFSFVARQQLIRTEAENYFIDLVFYNYILKCFVLLDIKTTKITHQDVGQMDMYIRMYDELKRNEGDNPTIGIVLCSETDHDIARYSVLNGNEQLFASKYKLYLPTEEELRVEIERQKEIFMLQQETNHLKSKII